MGEREQVHRREGSKMIMDVTVYVYLCRTMEAKGILQRLYLDSVVHCSSASLQRVRHRAHHHTAQEVCLVT